MTRTQTASTKTTRRAAPARATSKAPRGDGDATKTATPLLDVRGLLEKLKLPKLDVSGLIDSRRKDVEALLAANEQAYRGFEAVTRRQAEMLAQAMKGLKHNAKDTMDASGARARVGLVAEQVQQAFGQALADMKELAELSARSQQQVVDTLNKRLRESFSEVSSRVAGKK